MNAAAGDAVLRKPTSTRRTGPLTAFIVAAALLLASLIVGMAVGAIRISPGQMLAILMGNQSAVSPGDRTILLYIRLPRVITAGVIGASLSLAGVLFQGLFRNPMAEPYVLGTSGGAAFGAALGMFLFPHSSLLGFGAAATFAFLGAVLTITLVYMVARVGGRTPAVALLLSGFAISMILNEASTVLVYMRDELSSNARNLALWLHGSVAFSEWPQLIGPAIMLLIGTLFSLHGRGLRKTVGHKRRIFAGHDRCSRLVTYRFGCAVGRYYWFCWVAGAARSPPDCGSRARPSLGALRYLWRRLFDPCRRIRSHHRCSH